MAACITFTKRYSMAVCRTYVMCISVEMAGIVKAISTTVRSIVAGDADGRRVVRMQFRRCNIINKTVRRSHNESNVTPCN